MRRIISFSYILILFFLSGCAPSLKIPIQKYLIPAKSSFEKAGNLINFDPRRALEYYSEAKVYFQNFIIEAKGSPEHAIQVQEANFYIKKINYGIDFINAKEKYNKMDIEEICSKILGNLSLVPRYRERYNDILTTVRKFELYEYLETESQRLIKKTEIDLNMLEECAKYDPFEKNSLRHYQDGVEYYTAGQKYYTQWRQTKNKSYGNSTLEAFMNAIKEFRNVEALYTPQEYDEAQSKIKDAQRKIQEIEIWVSQPQRPIANAGSGQHARINTLVTLNGISSYDPDGTHLTYRWTQIAGRPITLSSSSLVRPTFTPRVAGNYTFRLVVNDGKLDSVPDVVTVTVKEPQSQPEQSYQPQEPYIDLGAFTTFVDPRDGVKKGTQKILDGTMRRGESRMYCFRVEKYGDLKVCITPGYSLEGGGLGFAGKCIFENDATKYKRFIRVNIRGGTQIKMTIRREQDSPDEFRFIFKLYPK